ncbi:hypothetical protein PG999_012287 [Apiospora kogelbergensis]|uniref:Uncharacterized protein n=1 Tax=Apiospora kogelbergensis TaxID=1337665 RepID=A0AAW0QFI3_9PEZI
MYLWNAYNIEIETYGHGQTWTAPGCNKGQPNPCNFDQFIKFIEMTRNRPGWPGNTGVGNARDLPVLQTAENLKTSGYTSNVDPVKLNPHKFTKQDQPTLKGLLDESFQAIQQARRDIPSKPGKSYDDIDKFVKNAGESLEKCIEFRKADQADNLIADFKAATAGTGFTPQHLAYKDPKPTLPNGQTYDEIDVDGTFKKTPNMGAQWEQYIENYVANYDTSGDKPLKHTTAILDLKAFKEDLMSPLSPPCSP